MLKHILPFSQRQESLEKGMGATDKALFTRAAIGNKRKNNKIKQKKWRKERGLTNKLLSHIQVKQSDRSERTNLY